MSGPRISDHALVRFLQRAGALDVEGLRAAIATSLADAHGAAVAIGGGDHLIVSNGMTFVVRGGVVTTVTAQGAPALNARLLKGPTGRG